MRLSDFIEFKMEAILSRWEEFAGTLLPAALRMDRSALRDHAEQILGAIAADLRTDQTRKQQEQKSRGEAPAASDETAAQTHAVLRATSGFSIRQLVAEYRALRASVLREYLDHAGDAAVPEDVSRFNEAIDQAIAESVDYFTMQVERWRNIFLGVLAHDLRSPLHAIQTTAELIARSNAPPEIARHIDRLSANGRRMAELLNDLLDFNRVSVGGGLHIEPRPADLVATCRQEVELQRNAYPSARIEFDAPAACPGVWDTSRVRQAVGNLISNAVKYASDGAVQVVVREERDQVSIAVSNHGPTLDEAERRSIFEPLVRGSLGKGHGDESAHLGLGLFIVRQAAEGHGGSVAVDSADGQTCFSMVLPRDASAARGAENT